MSIVPISFAPYRSQGFVGPCSDSRSAALLGGCGQSEHNQQEYPGDRERAGLRLLAGGLQPRRFGEHVNDELFVGGKGRR